MVHAGNKDHLVIPQTPFYRPPQTDADDDYSISNTTHEARRDRKAILHHSQQQLFDMRPSPIVEGPFLGALRAMHSPSE